MLRILSWSSGLGCDKMHHPDVSMFAPTEQPSSVNDLSLNCAVKRKRSPSIGIQTSSFSDSPPQQSSRLGDAELPQTESRPSVEVDIKQELPLPTHLCHSRPSSTMAGTQEADVNPQQFAETRLKQMRQTISAQLSLEILLKHKELRLIDQEIAKCQIALEQLRRCSEIPFPSTQYPSVLVTEGKGAALRRVGEQYPAKSPAPWGVTDGPYSRHYAKWLLLDPRFDGGESGTIQVENIMDAAVPARSTRGSFVEAGKGLKSRSILKSGSFQALSAGYGQPKEKATGPMLLKRKSDNVMVKLVCPDCARHDFGSAQGFINHCRIGHGRSFASHDAAAEACGEPVEYNENGTIKGAEPVTTPSSGHMHPLIRSAKLLPHGSTSTPASTKVSNPKARRTKKARKLAGSSTFLPSMQTPHLSAFVESQGLGLNLQELVTDAKIKVEPPESDHEEIEMEVDSPLPTNFGRHPHIAGSKQPSKSGPGKRHSNLLQSSMRLEQELPKTNILSFQSQHQLKTRIDDSQTEFMHPVIPSPTNESTQAPSLVDDDEDFDPQSPPSSDEIDDAEIDFDVQDDEHGDRTVLRGGDLQSPQTTCTPAPPVRTPVRRASTFHKSVDSKSENKNVSFASPSPHSEGSDRKRRKLGDSQNPS